jgi:hypothetical protein
MEVIRLIYVSRMTEECDMEAIQQILQVSRKKNKAQNITGILCYDPAFFMQCLEGPRKAVNELYAEILRDPRHKDVVLLEYCEARERKFANWTMALVTTANVSPETLEQYTGSGKFDPYSLHAADACRFLVQLAAQAEGNLEGR